MPGPRAKSSARPEELSLGWVVGVFGVRGEVRLHLHNRESQLLAKGLACVLVGPEGGRRTLTVSTRRGSGGRVVGRVEGVTTCEQAEALQGTELVLARSALPPTEPGEYYHHQLLGLAVEDETRGVIGRLEEIHQTGPVDLWAVRGGPVEVLVPALRQVVLAVDLEAGRVRVRLPDVAWDDGADASPEE